MRNGSVGPDLVEVLEAIGCSLPALPRRLRDALDGIAAQPHVPSLPEIAERWPSRRSFYRAWRERIDEPPSTFLRRVRAHHAQRLIEMGMSKKEAAHHAGYRSVDAMRRNLK